MKLSIVSVVAALAFAFVANNMIANASGAAVGGMLHQIQSAQTPAAPAFKPAPSDHQPPRFLPAIALYVDDRFMSLQVGKTFFYSCKEALDDTQTALAKELPRGGRAVGLCIPIPIYSVEDLKPAADPKKSSDNEV